MKKCVIFGLTDFAVMIRNLVESYTDIKIEAYVVDRQYMKGDTFDGLPVVAFEDVAAQYPKDEYSFFVALGYSHMNEVRKQKFQAVKALGYHVENFIHPRAVIEPTAQVGEGNIIFENAVLGYRVCVGDCNIIWGSANLQHECIVGDFNFIAGSTVFGGKTHIMNSCFFGMGAIVRGARTVADYTLVGAGGFLNENTETYSVYFPARSYRSEDKKSTDLI